MDQTARRDPSARDHRMSMAEVLALAPSLQLVRYFAATGAPHFDELNVSDPGFFEAVNAVVDSTPLEAWKTYMTWQILDWAAPWLSSDLVTEDFRFEQQLTGQQELPVRWKRCVKATDRRLGEALGQSYVDETFGADGKQRAQVMVAHLERALATDIAELVWMTDSTKRSAVAKLQAIGKKIGYPDRWRGYAALEIARGDLLGNVARATEFESRRRLQKIGKAVDRLEWLMTPPTVDAYYRPSLNEIVFPAGILQPPYFDRSMDDAVNFGGIGTIIGHELTHGFDDAGRKFDAQGNLRDWWSAADAASFEARARCIADQYSGITAVDDQKLNGRLTLGENIADNGGARIALAALHQRMAETKQDRSAKIDGYTPDQRFFLSYARIWCTNITTEQLRLSVQTDPHSPARWRVNAVLQNMPEFQQAFDCKATQPMVSPNACRVW